MAGRPQVSIRLATDGKAQVTRDFAEIGDSGEAQAKRYQTAWERASTAAQTAIANETKAAERLAAVTATPVQQQVNRATGVGGEPSGNARASAAALSQQLDQAERDARQLIAAIDPLFAAQARYEAQVERINAVKATGQITEQRYQQLMANEKAVLDQATAAAGRHGLASGSMRLGMQQLSFQIGDITQQMALGYIPLSRIFIQQAGQVIQAVQLMGVAGQGWIGFLGSAWGIGAATAAVALVPLISKLFETGSAIDAEVDRLKKQAEQSKVTEDAERAFGNTLEGVTKAVHDNAEALGKMDDASKSAAQTALEMALREAEKAKAIRGSTIALLQQADANLRNAQAVQFGAGGGASAFAATQYFQSQVDQLQADLKQIRIDAAEADHQVADATARMYQEAVLRDPVERIKKHYDDLIKAARERGLAEHQTYVEIARQTEKLKEQRDAEIKAQQERDRKAPANAGGTAIFDAQISSYFDAANRYRGLSETRDKGVLEAFFREANLQLDPEKVKWCAAFVNAVLATQGVRGTGSLAAASFLNFGKDDTKSPQRGDIVVLKTGAGDHVGFLDSIDKAGNVKVLAGNTSDKVAEGTYSKGQVQAIRRPPTPAESAAAADKAVSDALQAAQAFDSESAQLNQQYLQALAKVVGGYQDRAEVQERIAQDDHDAEAKQIAANLAAGKYGEATSALAQARARDLQVANDNVLEERQAAIALQSYVKSVQAQDSAASRDAKFKLDGLNYQESIARTAGERRDLQLQIIDIEYKEKERHLQYLLALDKLLGKTEEAADVAAQLAHLPAEKARAQDQANRSNQSPLGTYLDSLPKNMADFGEATQHIEVSGLQKFNEELDDALMKSKSLKDLWHNFGQVVHDVAAQILKDLIDLTIKMFIIRPLLQALGVSGGVQGFALGTEYFAGGMAWVGEHGPELVRLPRGSKVSPAAESRRIASANDNLRPVVVNNFNMAGAVVTDDLLREMDARAQAASQAGAELGVSQMLNVNERTFGRALGRR
jgi:uncharacterized protein (TIGR02594 family)